MPAAELERQLDRLRRQQAAIVSLARRPLEPADVEAALREICMVAASTLSVERASIWMLNADRTDLTCRALYELGKNAHSSGMVLQASEYPRYFAALETGRAIDAGDARTDPRTSEFADGYLAPLGITSMMDAAIREEGRVAGVVCHEHVGPPRAWLQDEMSFAGALADQVALVLAAAERRRLEQERDRMRQQLVHTQKLESLGMLAGGLAHEFNNLLASIVGNAALARDALPGAHESQEPLADVIKAAERASRLTRQLLTYSGRGRVVVEPIDVSVHVAEIAELIGSSTPSNVRLRLTLAEELPAIKADATQLQQALVNLVINGIEAIGDRSGGEVRITTSVRFLSAQDISALFLARGVSPGRTVMLEIEDTGCGMPAHVVGKMFDPFFTTKGSGRGLGLSAVLGIVRNHRGAIDVKSEPKVGTTVRVFLPAMDAALRPVYAAPPQELRGEGVVLVVDDEATLSRLVSRVLEQLGYSVVTAEGTAPAVELFRERCSEVGAVLVDLTMAGMSAPDAYRAIEQIRPNTPFVLMSGCDPSEDAQALIDAGRAVFLQKPFRPETLARKVREAIDQRTGR